MMATGDAPGQGAAAFLAPAERLNNHRITDGTTPTTGEVPAMRRQAPAVRYPLMQISGSSRATLRARPASSVASTTALTSL